MQVSLTPKSSSCLASELNSFVGIIHERANGHTLVSISILIISCIISTTSPLAQSVKRCGSQSEGPGFKPRRRRWNSSVRQTANGPCLSRLSCINEYKVFLRCLPVYGGTTSATIRWCNGASAEVFRKTSLPRTSLPRKGLLKKTHTKKPGLDHTWYN